MAEILVIVHPESVTNAIGQLRFSYDVMRQGSGPPLNNQLVIIQNADIGPPEEINQAIAAHARAVISGAETDRLTLCGGVVYQG